MSPSSSRSAGKSNWSRRLIGAGDRGRRRATRIPRVFAHQLLELGQLHGNGGGEAEALDQQFFGELGEPILDGSIEILDRLEDGERDDAVHHGARNLPRGCLLRNSRRSTSLLSRL